MKKKKEESPDSTSDVLEGIGGAIVLLDGIGVGIYCCCGKNEKTYEVQEKSSGCKIF